jgi:hypothetical protein
MLFQSISLKVASSQTSGIKGSCRSDFLMRRSQSLGAVAAVWT